MPTLDENKAAKCDEIDRKRRDLLKAARVEWNSKMWDVDTDDQRRLSMIAIRSLMSDWPATGYHLIASDNSLVEDATAAQAQALFKLVEEKYRRYMLAARTLKDSVEAAADQAALDAIDITTGWPT